MKTTNHGLHRLSAIILSAVLILISCTKVTYPTPSENPVHLTAEAQMKQITVENLFSMNREYSTDEMFEEGDLLIIENDWVRFEEEGKSRTKIIRIVVKENTTDESRTHSVNLGSGTKRTVLTVIQAGKSKQ